MTTVPRALLTLVGFGLVLLTYIQRMPVASQAGLDTFLFGQAATLLARDVATIGILGSVVLLIVLAVWKEFKLLCFDPDFALLLAQADVVVSMAGYNTVCELLTLRKRALLVPRVKPGQEQCIRAERMAALGLLRMLHPDQLTPATLMSALRTELEAFARHERVPQLRTLQGLDRVTAAIFDLLDIEARARGAQRDAYPRPRATHAPEIRSVA